MSGSVFPKPLSDGAVSEGREEAGVADIDEVDPGTEGGGGTPLEAT